MAMCPTPARQAGRQTGRQAGRQAGKAGKAGMAGQASKVGPKIATIGFGFWQAQKVDKGLLLKFVRLDNFCVQIDSRVFRQVETYHFAT